jgi:hypothetical protein
MISISCDEENDIGSKQTGRRTKRMIPEASRTKRKISAGGDEKNDAGNKQAGR